MLFDIYVYIREQLANGGGSLPGPTGGSRVEKFV